MNCVSLTRCHTEIDTQGLRKVFSRAFSVKLFVGEQIAERDTSVPKLDAEQIVNVKF